MVTPFNEERNSVRSLPSVVETLPNFLFFAGKFLLNFLEQLAWTRCSREHFRQLLSKRQGLLWVLVLQIENG